MNAFSLYKRHIKTIPGAKSYILVAVAVLLLGLAVTFFSWYVDRQRTLENKSAQVNEQASAIRDDVVNRLNIYEQILHGASGLFDASDSVTGEEWKKYIQQYDVNKTYPGINGFGFAEYVPAGQGPENAPIIYSESYLNIPTTAIGFDILSDPGRRAAAEKARDSGEVIISEGLVLAGNRQTFQPGFIMYAAVYGKDSRPKTPEERRVNLRGYVFAGYRAANFFSQAINKTNLTAYSDLQIFDGMSTDKNKLLYQTNNFNKYDQNMLSQPFTINSFGRDWTFRFAGPIENNQADTQRSNMILIGGVTLSCAIAGFLFLIMLTRARAIVYLKQDEAQQAKDDLLSLASHQLRTPATAVKQYLGMILEGYTGKVNKKQLPSLQKAYSSNERQLDTINQILYVAKADAGRLSINRNNFDINFLIKDIANDLSDTFEENDQTLKIDQSRKKLKIFADEASLRMVVENLVSNASKYSNPGSAVTVKTGIKNQQIYITISDEGVGIAEEDYGKLFKKFSRIDNDLSLQVGGSGIGLYIDKVLIELHGGNIEVDSKLGHGSTFTIYLPSGSAINLTDGGKKNDPL